MKGLKTMKKTIEVDDLASFEFWYNCFKARSKAWQKENLKRLKYSISIFESVKDNADKIKALELLLNK